LPQTAACIATFCGCSVKDGGFNVLGIDYRFWTEQKRAQETRIKQEQRAGVIDQLLTEANKPAQKTDAEATAIKEVAPAK
jgi:hypothetical protein